MQCRLTFSILLLTAACRSSAEPLGLRVADATAVRVRDCDGPATSLPAALAVTLPPRSGRMRPDDEWAGLAATVPGGFAGVLYDFQDHKPVLLLTKPELAAEAKRALAGRIPGFPVADAVVRQARWDFLQLVNWYNYLLSPVFADRGIVSGDKDEALNRIHYGVLDSEARDRVVRTLVSLEVPCDLVVVDIRKPFVTLPAPSR